MMNIDEPIHLEPYQESWREAFAHEEGVLVRKLGIRIVAVEHFGSTSVPGMTAKPIVDLLVGVADVCQADEVISQLQEQGYAFLGEAGIPGRLYFRKRAYEHCSLIQKRKKNVLRDCWRRPIDGRA